MSCSCSTPRPTTPTSALPGSRWPRAPRGPLARAHLQSSDRVGLVTFGGYTSWITARGGERAGYALLDKLLGARPAAGANRTLAWLPLRLIPADAAVLAVTPLHALHAVDALVDLRRRGRRVDGADHRHDRPASGRPGAGPGTAVLGPRAGASSTAAHGRRNRHRPLAAGGSVGRTADAPGPDGATLEPTVDGSRPMKLPLPRHERTACPGLRAVVAGAAMLATLVLVARAGTTATDAATRPVVLAGAAATLLQALSLLRWPPPRWAGRGRPRWARAGDPPARGQSGSGHRDGRALPHQHRAGGVGRRPPQRDP